jgi:hypothetical protein
MRRASALLIASLSWCLHIVAWLPFPNLPEYPDWMTGSLLLACPSYSLLWPSIFISGEEEPSCSR